MTDLLSMLVHELRTPLTALRGAISLLESEEPGEPAQGLTRIAARNAGRLAELVDDVAAYARATDPGRPLTRADIDVGILLEDAAVAAAAAGRTIVADPSAPTCRVHTDETLAREAIGRLVAAAIRVTPPGGRVTLASMVEDEVVVVRVTDEGPAVPEADQAALFVPLSPPVRRAADGSERPSFDLAIAAAAAERLGGRVSFSPRQQGGEARLTLGPASAPPPRP